MLEINGNGAPATQQAECDMYGGVWQTLARYKYNNEILLIFRAAEGEKNLNCEVLFRRECSLLLIFNNSIQQQAAENCVRRVAVG